VSGPIRAVDNLQRVASRLKHNSLVELFKKLNLTACLVKANLHEYLSSVYIDKGHGDTVGLNHVQQEHHSVADLELRNLVIFQHILELVSR